MTLADLLPNEAQVAMLQGLFAGFLALCRCWMGGQLMTLLNLILMYWDELRGSPSILVPLLLIA